MKRVWAVIAVLLLIASCSDDEIVNSADDVAPLVQRARITYACGFDRNVAIGITETGSGLDWDSVYIDVYTLEGPDDQQMCISNLIHTVTPDALAEIRESGCDSGTCEIPIEMNIAPNDWVELRYIVYSGQRERIFDDNAQCEVFEYDWDSGGVVDIAGNHAPVSNQRINFGLFICDGTGEAPAAPSRDVVE